MRPAVVAGTGAPCQGSAGIASVGDRYGFVDGVKHHAGSSLSGFFHANFRGDRPCPCAGICAFGDVTLAQPGFDASLSPCRFARRRQPDRSGARRRSRSRGAGRWSKGGEEHFALFAGLREDSLLPYSSHYLAETLYGRPLHCPCNSLAVLFWAGKVAPVDFAESDVAKLDSRPSIVSCSKTRSYQSARFVLIAVHD